jgi:hypothetical protein
MDLKMYVLTSNFKVTLSCRSNLKTQQFDVSLDWVGRQSNIKFADFWQEKDYTSKSPDLSNLIRTV